VPLRAGQDANVVAQSAAGTRRYHVRCLPEDFPSWSFKRFGRPAAQWYLFAPVTVPNKSGHYVTLIDTRGTPVWWVHATAVPFNSHLLPSGELAWARWYGDPFAVRASSAWEVHRLDGSLVRTLRTVGSPTDMHDMVQLGHGRYLLMTYRLRRHIDLTSRGSARDGVVADGELQEIDRRGRLVWRWSALDHIPMSENAGVWKRTFRTIPGGRRAFDWFHLNSAEPDGHGGIVISGRHVNAVYRIDRSTGKVTWKLGGTRRPESLTVTGDPSRTGTFIGQHDASLLPDGTLTVYDNHAPYHPRAVRFAIDARRHAARLLEQVHQPGLVWSPAEGTATRLPDSNWVVSWGANPVLSERTANDRLVWRLRLSAGQSYGIQPIPAGRVSAERLRRGMDRMHPRR
jgi:hypothetical protein